MITLADFYEHFGCPRVPLQGVAMHCPDYGHSSYWRSGGTTNCFNRTLPVLSKKFLYKILLTTSKRFLFFTRFWKKELAKVKWLGSGFVFTKMRTIF